MAVTRPWTRHVPLAGTLTACRYNITDLLTTLVLLNTKPQMKNIDSKITDVATCKVIKKVLLDVN